MDSKIVFKATVGFLSEEFFKLQLRNLYIQRVNVFAPRGKL
jgi:hypothetical protein